MPRGVPKSGKRSAEHLSNPEVREKRQAALKAGAAKRRVTKLVAKLAQMDLAPLDEEIAEHRARIRGLEAAREIALKLRGAGLPPPQNIQGPAASEPQAKPTKTVADVVVDYLANLAMPAKATQIAAKTNVPLPAVEKALKSDDRFVETIAGWRME